MADPVYQSLHSRTRWLRGFLYAWLALSLVETLPRLLLLLQATGSPIDAGMFGDQEVADMIVIFQTLALLACLVAYCFWIYRANANLHALGVRGMDYSPRWAVGSNFIPVASLWWGYQSMKEIWDKSGPPDSDLDGRGWLLPVWWIAWVVTNIVSNIVLRLEHALNPTTLAVLNFASPVSNMIAGAALSVIISKIAVAQSQQQSFKVFS